jgi:hypothetical protein
VRPFFLLQIAFVFIGRNAMGGWGRWLIVMAVGGALMLADVSNLIIATALLFIGIYFLEVDVVRLKREASGLRERLDALEQQRVSAPASR